MAAQGSSLKSDQFLLVEYPALREEIVRRMEWQHQIVIFALAATSTIVTLGTPFFILLSPILIMFLATLWAHYDWRVYGLGKYILKKIELHFIPIDGGWEKSLDRSSPTYSGKLERRAARGIFYGIQIAAIVVAWIQGPWEVREYLILATDLVCVAITVFIMLKLPKHRIDQDVSQNENNKHAAEQRKN